MATEFGVDLVFRAIGGNAAKKLTGQTERLSDSAKEAQQNFNRLNGQFKKQQATTKKLGGELLKAKREYDRLTKAAKAAAIAGEDTSKIIKAAGRAKKSVADLRVEYQKAKLAARQFGTAAEKAAGQAARANKKSGIFGGSSLRKGSAALGAGYAAGGGPGALGGGVITGAFALGGPKVAAITAAGLGTAALIKFAQETAISTSQTAKFKIALESVAGSGYEESLSRLEQINKRYNSTNAETIQGFTQILAGAKSANVPLKDALKTYEGLSVANKALGGNQEDLNGILRAATQIFSKNKVQAEELRGQIGDRLPGAFGQFAKATSRSSQQLDKDMADGKVTVADFVTFATSYLGPNSEWEKAAKNIADSPEEAGRRLKVAMEGLKEALGPLTRQIGAFFQNMASDIVKSITWAATKINQLQMLATESRVNNLITAREDQRDKIANMMANQGTGWGQASPGEIAAAREIEARLTKNAAEAQQRLNRLRKLVDAGSPFDSKDPLNPDVENPDNPDLTNKPRPSLQSLIGTDFASNTRIKILREEKIAQEEIIKARMAGNRAVVKDLETYKDLIPNIFRARALEDEMQRIRGMAPELLAKGIKQSEIDNQLKKLQNDLTQTNLDLEQQQLGLVDERLQREEKVRQKLEEQWQEMNRQEKLARDGMKNELRRLEIGDEAFQREQERSRLVAEGVSGPEVDAYFQRIDALKQLNEQTEQLKQLWADVGQAVKGALVDTIQSAIEGTADLQDILKDLASQLSSMFLNAGFSMLGRALNLPGFANGGVLPANGPAIVGERGPELAFSNGGQTRIVPLADAYGDARSAMGGSAQTTDGAFNDAAAAMAVTAERRSDSAVATAEMERLESAFNNSDPVRVEVDTVNVGGLDVVTTEQFAAGVQAGVLQAQAEMIGKLKNRPALRRQIGI